jgi:hypothetical protein
MTAPIAKPNGSLPSRRRVVAIRPVPLALFVKFSAFRFEGESTPRDPPETYA